MAFITLHVEHRVFKVALLVDKTSASSINKRVLAGGKTNVGVCATLLENILRFHTGHVTDNYCRNK